MVTRPDQGRKEGPASSSAAKSEIQIMEQEAIVSSSLVLPVKSLVLGRLRAVCGETDRDLALRGEADAGIAAAERAAARVWW